MKIYYKYTLIILLILIIFLTIYHIKFYYKYHNTYEISQLDFNQTDYSKEIIDNTIYDKKLAIIILHDDDTLIGNKKMFLKDTNVNKSEKKMIFPPKYKKELGFINLAFSSPLNYNMSYNILINNQYTSPIKKQLYDRMFLYGVDGITKIILFNPIEEKNIYPNYKKYENFNDLESNVVFNSDYKNYPLFKNSKYIEIILNPGNCLYIPTHWWYCYINEEDYDNVLLEIKSDTYFTNLVKLPKYIKYLIKN
jgi:hypothetical protein